MLAGIITDLRVINGQRGKLALFKLDDKSATIEARADEKLINEHKNLLKDDALIIAMGKAQPDRFSGGMQFTITQLWDLEQARCRFGRYLRVALKADGTSPGPDVAKLLREFPAQREMTDQGELVRGLLVRFALERLPGDAGADSTNAGAQAEEGAYVELQLGDAARFYPSDAALARWRSQADAGRAVIAYE